MIHSLFTTFYKIKYRLFSSFGPWAHKRIEETAPDFDYFPIYAHSMLHEKHLWCYNKDGLINKTQSTRHFMDVKRIGLLDKLAGIPFTHSRQKEDLCVIATKKHKCLC